MKNIYFEYLLSYFILSSVPSKKGVNYVKFLINQCKCGIISILTIRKCNKTWCDRTFNDVCQSHCLYTNINVTKLTSIPTRSPHDDSKTRLCNNNLIILFQFHFNHTFSLHIFFVRVHEKRCYRV